MTTRERFLKLAAVVAALVLVFLPKELFSIIYEGFIQFCIILNIVITATGWEFVAVYAKFESLLGRTLKVVVMYEVIGLGEKALSVAMIYFLLNYGIVFTFLTITPSYFLYCIFVVAIYDFFLERGCDLLEIENLRSNGASHKFLGWILRRRATIFFVGSCIQLDPDLVTLLLRKNRKTLWLNSLTITLPSTVISMTFWTVVYVSAIKGYEWAKWLIE
jgi:hypothetical protein